MESVIWSGGRFLLWPDVTGTSMGSPRGCCPACVSAGRRECCAGDADLPGWTPCSAQGFEPGECFQLGYSGGDGGNDVVEGCERRAPWPLQWDTESRSPETGGEGGGAAETTKRRSREPEGVWGVWTSKRKSQDNSRGWTWVMGRGGSIGRPADGPWGAGPAAQPRPQGRGLTRDHVITKPWQVKRSARPREHRGRSPRHGGLRGSGRRGGTRGLDVSFKRALRIPMLQRVKPGQGWRKERSVRNFLTIY